MMKLLRTTLPALLLMTFLSGSALAQAKIATVDLQKLFDNYYKTKIAQDSIQARAADLDKTDKGMKEDYNKGNEEYKTLVAQSVDQALSPEERDRKKQDAEKKQKQLQDAVNSIKQFEQQSQATLADQRQRMRDGILTDIKAAVSVKAKSGGYSLVLDAAALTANNTQAIVYNNGDNDLTEAVLGQLNAGAPIDVTKPATTNAAPSLSNPRKP